MNRFYTRLFGIATGILACQIAPADLFESGAVNAAIPDNTGFGITNSISVNSMNGNIDDISVTVNIGAADDGYVFNGDIYLYLQHGDNISILLNRIGKTASNPYGYDDNGFNVTLSLTGDDIHSYGSADGGTLTGIWGADGRYIDPDLVLDTNERTALLDVFLNTDANENWTLFAADLATGGTAQLNSWSLTLETIPEPATLSLIGLISAGAFFLRRRVAT